MGLCEKAKSMLIGVSESNGESETKLENTLQDIIQENFPNLARQANIQIQEIQRTSQRYSSRRATLRHIIVRFTRVEMKEKIIRAERERERMVRLPTKGSPSDSQWISQQNSYKTEESEIFNILKELSTQNFIPSQTKLHKRRRNKILYEQASKYSEISSPPGLLYKSS